MSWKDCNTSLFLCHSGHGHVSSPPVLCLLWSWVRWAQVAADPIVNTDAAFLAAPLHSHSGCGQGHWPLQQLCALYPCLILCNGTSTDLIVLMVKPFSDHSISIGPLLYLNLAGRNQRFSCCLLMNLPRATLQMAKKAMCLWHRAEPANVSVDQDFFSDMFHVLKSNDLFCESWFFSVPCVI